MKPKLLLCLAFVLSDFLVGCAANSKPTAVKEAPAGYGLNEITSHIFGVEGNVVGILKTGATLESITVKLIKPLRTALGWVPYETPGEIIVIRFDEPLSKLGKLQLANGDIVEVAFGDGIQHLNPDDWGSNFSWLSVEKGGRFYNTTGEIIDSDPDVNL